jgi:hypothetical protein
MLFPHTLFQVGDSTCPTDLLSPLCHQAGVERSAKPAERLWAATMPPLPASSASSCLPPVWEIAATTPHDRCLPLKIGEKIPQ